MRFDPGNRLIAALDMETADKASGADMIAELCPVV